MATILLNVDAPKSAINNIAKDLCGTVKGAGIDCEILEPDSEATDMMKVAMLRTCICQLTAIADFMDGRPCEFSKEELKTMASIGAAKLDTFIGKHASASYINFVKSFLD